jgi:hypothetical protein
MATRTGNLSNAALISRSLKVVVGMGPGMGEGRGSGMSEQCTANKARANGGVAGGGSVKSTRPIGPQQSGKEEQTLKVIYAFECCEAKQG